MSLWIKILIGLIAGMFVGVYLGPHASMLKPIGDIFLNLISMIIVPLVLSSIVIGITNVRNNKKLGSMGVKTMLIFFTTTVLALFLGIIISYLFSPGVGLNLTMQATLSQSDSPTLGKMLLDLVPQNPITALVEGNILQIMVFAFFFGIAINLTGERARPLIEIFESLTDVLYKLTSVVMEFAPIGVFAMMAWLSGAYGFSVVLAQLKFVVLYYIASIFFIVTMYCSLLWFGAKVHPWPLFKGMADALVFAFSTCSSSATLPIALSCIQKKVGVSRNIASFVLPLGSVLNMNGTGIFLGMGTVFVAQAYGIELGLSGVLLLVISSILSVAGSAGFPGGAFIMLSYVFSVLGLPLEGMVLFIGIDRARDMCSTVLNIFGDAVCAVYIARGEGELDERIYYSERIVSFEGDEI